ncbi:MAG: efflux RND transporter periplasmic adaptor subunit [Hyphomicrobiaceae bacterium]
MKAIAPRPLVGALIAACGILLIAAGPADAQRRKGRGAQTTPVTLADVELVPIRERVAAVGSGRARRQVTIATRSAGIVEKVLFEGGKMVDANQPLIQLHAETEEITVETAAAQRAQAADAVDRLKQLTDGAVTRVARAEADTALKVADAALRRAREELDRMTIRAPFAGIVGLTNIQVGDYISVGTQIASLDDRTSILVEFTVPESVAPLVKPGLAIRASLVTRSGEVYQGKIGAVGTRIDPETRTLDVRGEIPNPTLALIPGSTFSISVRLPGEQAPLVPGLAVQWDRQGAYVWRLTAGNTVERVGIAIISRDGDRVMVDAKLQGGDKVIHEGGDQLRPGQTVMPQGT